MVPDDFDERTFVLDPSLFAEFNGKVVELSKALAD